MSVREALGKEISSHHPSSQALFWCWTLQEEPAKLLQGDLGTPAIHHAISTGFSTPEIPAIPGSAPAASFRGHKLRAWNTGEDTRAGTSFLEASH